MSKEAVTAFIKASAEDRILGAHLETADSPATVVELAREQGYDFDEAEYVAVVEEIETENGRGLEDSELEAVAGGTTKEPDRTDSDWIEEQNRINKYGEGN